MAGELIETLKLHAVSPEPEDGFGSMGTAAALRFDATDAKSFLESKDHSMNGTNRWTKKIGFVGCGALLGVLTGCTLYQGQTRYGDGYYEPSGQADAAYAEIRAESDFYEPLSPYGRWEVIGSYGRCWIPSGVDAGWSPYSEGYWQQTDAGWYWASDEPWGWATYHYGRWDWSPQIGWYWMPQTQWAPAWVSWRQGGGYVGWAPLGPSMRAGERGGPAHGYVFAEERRFLDPVRSRTIRANDSAFDRTADIVGTHTMNRGRMDDGPGTAHIEQVSGRKIQAAPVRELRTRDEAKVPTRHQPATSNRMQNTQGTMRNQAQPPERNVVPAQKPRRGEQPPAMTPAPQPQATKPESQPPAQNRVTRPMEEKHVPSQPEGPKVAPLSPSNNSRQDVGQQAIHQGPGEPKAVGKGPEQPAMRAGESNQKAQPVSEPHAKPEPAASDQNRKNAPRDDHKPNAEN
jgi:hypothetical protein